MGMLARLSHSLFGGVGTSAAAPERRTEGSPDKMSILKSSTVLSSPMPTSTTSPTKKSECVLDQLETYWREIEGGDLLRSNCSPFKDGGPNDHHLLEDRRAGGLGIMAH